MEQAHDSVTAEIMGRPKLPQDCKCYKLGFGVFKARDIGLESLVECLEEDPYTCPFLMSDGYSNYCKCPVCVHIAKEWRANRLPISFHFSYFAISPTENSLVADNYFHDFYAQLLEF
jgi:hypothetical protein